MILAHNINSTNIFVKTKERREKRLGAKYQAAYGCHLFFRKDRENGSENHKCRKSDNPDYCPQLRYVNVFYV